MENCLVTKLKGSVDNPHLSMLDSLFLDLINLSGSAQCYLSAGEHTITIKASDGTEPSGTSGMYSFDGGKSYNVLKKSQLTSINIIDLQALGLSMPDLKYCVSMTGFALNGYVDIDKLPQNGIVSDPIFLNWRIDNTRYNEFVNWLRSNPLNYLRFSPFNGTPSTITTYDLGSAGNATKRPASLNVWGVLTGAIEDFAAARRTLYGETTGSVTIEGLHENLLCTYNGVAIPAPPSGGVNTIVSWDANSVTLSY